MIGVVGDKECAIKRSTSRCTIQEGTPEGALKTQRGALPCRSGVAHVKTVGFVGTLNFALSDAECGREARGPFAVMAARDENELGGRNPAAHHRDL